MVEKKYYLVQSRETLQLLFDHIQSSDIVALDTETDSLNMRKGSIIGWSISGKEGVGFYLPTLVWDVDEECLKEQFIDGKSTIDLSKKLLTLLKGKKIVCHNSSFDIRYIKNFFGVDLLPDLWVDTIMLVHTVQEEGAGMGVFGLKPLAISIQEHIGLDVETAANQEQIELKESIKRNGGSTTKDNYEIYKADLEILGKYAAADTDLTLRLCNYFLKRLEEEGLEKFFFEDEVMPIYKEVTIPMEEYGVELDMELLQKTKIDIEKDLTENKKVVLKSLMDLPETKEWIVDTALKNYPPKHKGAWARELIKNHSLPLPKNASGSYILSKRTIEELEESPIKEFLLTGNLDLLDGDEVLKISLSLWKEENEGEYINIQSKKHLGEIVFKYLGIKPKSKTDKGQDQFDMDMIEDLSKTYTWAENLRIYNKLLKIKSTYIERFLEKSEDGRYYPYYKQHGTVSGRYGSDMQQLPKPKEEGEDVPLLVHYSNMVRAFFIAGKGRKFIDDDFESLEPHCFSSITGDKGLQDIFNNGWDFYSTIAIRTEKLDQDKKTYPNGVSPDKKADNFLKKIDPLKRQKAKAYALGIPYGMSSYALAKTLDITQKEAERLVNGYLDGFPGLKQWMLDSRKQIKEHGFIRNKVGRIRHLLEAKEIYITFKDQLLDWRFRRELETSYGKERITRLYRNYKNSLNTALNYQLQSLAASIVNRAALRINRKAKELGIDARVCAQIHDQLVINVEESRALEFAPYVQDLMENTTKLEGVTLKAPFAIADNLRDGH